MPGFDQLIKELAGQNLKLAIASSSRHPKFIAANLKIEKYFNLIIDGSMITNHKPDPEIYVKTATELKVDPKNCLVIEDSASGVIAAKIAGMKVIAVPNWSTKDQNFSPADLMVTSLKEINWQIISSI